MAALLISSAGQHAQCRLSSYWPRILCCFLLVACSSGRFSHIRGTHREDHEGNAIALVSDSVRRYLQPHVVSSLEVNWRDETPQHHGRCSDDSDCEWHARCSSSSHKCKVKDLGEMLTADILMCVLAFVIAGFSLAAGVGGGGLYVPLLMAILSFDTRVATALSQSMLFGGALAAFAYNSQQSHPSRQERPLINFELALLMAPALMGGAQIGSVIHALAPPALTLTLLLIVLGDAAVKGVRNANRLRAKEDKEEDTDTATATEPAAFDDKAAEINARSEAATIRLILVWLLCIVFVATKGVFFEMCSTAWWILTFVSAATLCALSWYFAGSLSLQEQLDADDIDLSEQAYPLAKMSILAGVIAAMCGIGGGMVMGPILVESKVPPPIAAATTATTLVVLSTSTLLIYVSRGLAPTDYAVCLSIFACLGAAVGKVVVGWWVRKTGKQSIIVWTLAGVTVCSMFLMGFEGVRTIARDPHDAFVIRNLCEGQLHHTVPSTG